MTTTTTDGQAAPAGESTPAAAAAAAPSDGGSLLSGVTPPASATPAQGDPAVTPSAAAEGDWLPEKFRVTGEDGKIDEAASARKLAESYRQLEAHKGPMPQAPATPDAYKIEGIKGPDGQALPPNVVADFIADPLFKGFATEAHKHGMTDAQLSFVVERYMNMAPQLLEADMKLSLDDARAELQTVWKDDATMQRNLEGVVRAINGFGAEAEDVPGSRARLMEKYGRDPDFIAFAAAVAGEMKEDKLPAQVSVATAADVESLQKSEAYWNPNHPDHTSVKKQVDSFYTSKYGNKRR